MLAQIVLTKHIYLIDNVPTGEFDSNHKFLQPARHIPHTSPTHDRNMSLAEGYIFYQLRSMKNVQCIMYSPVANK